MPAAVSFFIFYTFSIKLYNLTNVFKISPTVCLDNGTLYRFNGVYTVLTVSRIILQVCRFNGIFTALFWYPGLAGFP